MAEIAVTPGRMGSWLKFEWLAVTEADTFAKVYLNHNVADMLIEVEGTFGSPTTTVTLDGWTLTEAAKFASVDPAGTTISIATNDASFPIRDAWPFFRPKHTGGTTTSINVRLYMKVAI